MFNPLFTPRVLLLVFNPDKIMTGDPFAMTTEFIQGIGDASAGRVRYRVQRILQVDDFPTFSGGRRYDVDTYNAVKQDPAKAWKDGNDWAMVDYTKLAQEYQAHLYDEIWMWGGGYFGFYESRMVGERAYFVNAPPLVVKGLRPKIFMGFNWERQTDMVFHAFGHRVESIMRRADPLRFNAWLSQVGTVHTAKGHTGEYSYGAEGHDAYIRRWHKNIFAEWWKFIAAPRIVV